MIGFADLQTIRKTGLCPLCGSSVNAQGAGAHARGARHIVFARRQELLARGWVEFPRGGIGASPGCLATLEKFGVPHEALTVPARGKQTATWHLFAPGAVVSLLRNQVRPLNHLVEKGLRKAGQLAPAKQEQFFAAAAAAIKLGASPLDTFEALT